jgi:putative ABC transport system substrate-binding protein
MERRTFLGSVAIGAALFSVLSIAIIACAWAQQPAKLPKVAILNGGAATTKACGAVDFVGASVPCFLEGMRNLGYVDGQNVSYVFRFAEGDFKKLPALATELVNLRPDVIVTAGTGADAAARATTTIPIVVGPTSEEMLTRLAGNLARPIGNVTGVTLVSVEQNLKCLQLVKEIAPATSQVAVLLSPDNIGSRDYLEVLGPAAALLGLTLIKIDARNVSDLPQAFAMIGASGANAIFLRDDPELAGTGTVRKQVSEWAVKRGLPVVSSNAYVATDGGLISLATDLPALARRSAFYVHRILLGAKPSDLPVERPTTYKLSVNRSTAKALGLTIPQSLLLRADEVIE